MIGECYICKRSKKVHKRDDYNHCLECLDERIERLDGDREAALHAMDAAVKARQILDRHSRKPITVWRQWR